MADDRTNNIETRTLFDDVLKTSKSASQFGPVRVFRVPEKPADSFGRNGDLCIIDNTAVSSIEIAIEQCPTDVGFCQKIPADVPGGPNRAASTVNGADLVGSDSFTINGASIVLQAGSVFVKDASDAINAAVAAAAANAVADPTTAAALHGISTIGLTTSAPGTVVAPYALPGYQIIINGVTVTFAVNGGTGYIASQIDAASIPFILVSTLGDKITITHTRGGEINLGGANLAQIMGTPTVSGGTMSLTNEDGTTVTLVDVTGIPLATMGFPLTIPNSPLVCGGTWQCFTANGIEIKDHGTSLGVFETIDFTGTGVVITDGGGGEAIVDISGVVGTLDIFKNVFGDTGSVIASGPNSNLRIEGSGIITTSIVGDTLTIASTGASAQNLVETFTGDIGSFTAGTPTDTLNILGTGLITTTLVGNTLTISSSGAGGQNLWLTIQDDVAATISASSTTDTLIVVGGTGISTAVAGSTLTITNTAPNVDQNLFETFTGNTGTTTANTTTDTLNIVGTGIVSTSMVGDTLTISSSGGADQNLWETMASDSGSVAANTSTDTFTIAGGTGISTAIAGDTLTITNDSPNVDQNLVDKFVSDSGTFTAAIPADTLSIVGGGVITTSVTGSVLTISSSGAAAQNLWETMASDSGTTLANSPTDTFTIAGGTGITTAISGDTLTITNSSPGAPDQNIWLTIQDDGASTISAASTTDTLTVAGAGGITTSVSGSTLTITGSGGQIYTDTREPTGFVNRTDSVISFSDVAPRLLTISVLAPATQYQYYIHGVVYTETATKTLTIPNTDGVHFIYFDNTQTLQSTTTFFDGLILDNALVAFVYWNSANNTSVMFGDERHGITMDGETHLHFHLSLGCQYTSGLLINGTLNPDVASPIDADVQVDVATGTIRDEDLSHDIVDNGGKVNVFDLEQDISPIAQIPVLYRLGTGGLWYIKPADNFPFIYSGDGTGYVGGTNALPPYNQFTGASWQLTEVGNNSFFLVHIYATNDIRHPIVAIQGITEYTNKPAGRDAAALELSQITGLPFLEFTPIATLIAEARTVYANTPQIRFRTTDDGDDYIDWRGNLSFGSAGGGTVQNTYANITDGVTIASAAIPNDTITFTGAGGMVVTVSSNPDTVTIDSNGINDLAITNTSTGTYTGGLLTINGGDATKFDIAAGTGQIVDHATDPLNPTLITVTWGAIIGTTAVNIGVADATGVYIDSTGSVVQLPIIGSNIDHKDKVFIGQMGHAQPSAIIQAARNNNDPIHGPAERLGDLSRALGPFNVTGNIYNPNGNNLLLDKSPGNSHSVGINFQISLENPDVSTDPSLSGLGFRYGRQDGVGGFTTSTAVTATDPAQYDDGSGTLQSVPVGRWTIQPVYWFPGANETRIEYGQYLFQTQQAALDILPDPRHVSNPVFAGVGILRAFLIMRADATDLTDSSKAIIVEGAKFGAGAGGQFSNSITDLQQAYDNSVTPEIVTDSIRGALTIIEGTAVGGNLIEGVDDTATQVFAVDTAGDVTISGSGAAMAVTVINSQPMLTLVDTTRTNKILSVAEQNLAFSENRLNDLDWINVGTAVDSDSGYIMDFDGTVVFATGHCENTNAFSKNIHLFINGVDNGSLGTLSGGANATFINTTINLDFSQGDRIRLQAQDGISGIIEDTVVKVSVKWRG